MAVRKRAKKKMSRPGRKPAKGSKPARAARPTARGSRASRPAMRSVATRRPSAARTQATSGANGIGCVLTHFDYTTHSVEDMRRFYSEVLGFTDATLDPQFDYLLVRTGPSSSIGFMPPMPGPPEQWRPPREPAIYLHVTDVNRAHQALKTRGVTFQQDPTDMPWGHRVAILRDPEGRQLFLAQPIARARVSRGG